MAETTPFYIVASDLLNNFFYRQGSGSRTDGQKPESTVFLRLGDKWAPPASKEEQCKAAFLENVLDGIDLERSKDVLLHFAAHQKDGSPGIKVVLETQVPQYAGNALVFSANRGRFAQKYTAKLELMLKGMPMPLKPEPVFSPQGGIATYRIPARYAQELCTYLGIARQGGEPAGELVVSSQR